MIGFILSKLNLLILVTAIFAIVAYFSFWLGESMVSQQALQIINRYARNAENVIFAPNQCNVTSVTIPAWINFFGSIETGNRFFYLLDISKIENVSVTAGGKPMNNLIISVLDKKTKNVIAAKSFGTTAKIRLFSWNPKAQGVEGGLTEVDKNTTLNPQSAPVPTNSVYLVKEIYNGESYFYVIPCSSQAHGCEANLQKVGDLVASQRNGVSPCLAVAESCRTTSAGDLGFDSIEKNCKIFYYCINCDEAECKNAWQAKEPAKNFNIVNGRVVEILPAKDTIKGEC